MLAQRARSRQTRAATLERGERGRETMSDGGKCPMGKHPWLATFLALAFILMFLASKLGLL